MSKILLPFCEIWGLTVLLMIVFALAGDWLYRLSFVRRDSEDDHLRWSLSCFLGMYLYLGLFRLFGSLMGARLACYLGLFVLLVLGGMHVRRERSGLFSRDRPWRVGAACLVLFLAFTLLTFTFWMQPPAQGIHVNSHSGTAHSGRYSNISLYIEAFDRIPRINQNYGKSLLVATHLFLGTGSPLASLEAWLSASLAVWTLVLFGLFRGVLPTARDAWVGTFLVSFCNIALSASHVFVIDSVTPFVFTGNTDTTTGYATWVGWILWLYGWLSADQGQPYRRLAAPVVLAFAWNLCAPQNIVMGLLLCGAFVVLTTVRRAAPRRARMAGLIGVILAATFLGASQGGMLMPRRWSDRVDLPGLMTPYSGQRGVQLMPGLPFFLDGFGECVYQAGDRTPTDAQLLADARTLGLAKVRRALVFRLESHLWDSLRILFFPILGIVGLAALLLDGQAPAGVERREYFRFWDICAAISFLAGFGITFGLSFHDFKWELSRFLIPGVLTGLVCLVFFAYAAGRLVARSGVRATMLLVLVVACTVAPVVESVFVIRRRASNGNLRERIDLLFRVREILPEEGPEGARDGGPPADSRQASSRSLPDLVGDRGVPGVHSLSPAPPGGRAP